MIPLFLLLVLAMMQGLNRHSNYAKFRDWEIACSKAMVASFLEYYGTVEETETEDNSGPIKGYEVELELLKAHESGDVRRILRAQKEALAHDIDISSINYPPEASAVYYATQDEILARGVQPVYVSIDIARGLVNSPFTKKELLGYLHDWNIRNAQPSVTYIMNGLFKEGLAVLAMAILAVSLALGLSDETHDIRTIYLLNTQPLHRKRIYFGKLIGQGAVFLAMILIMAVVLFGGLKLAGSPTEANFPAVKYLNTVAEDYSGEKLRRLALTGYEGEPLSPSTPEFYVGFTFRDMMAENLEMALLLVLSGLFLVAFALLISMKIRHKIGVSLGAALFFGLGYLVSRYVLKGLGTFLPFIWLNSPLVATGEASMIFNLDFLTGPMGLAVLALWLAAFVFLGYRIYSKTGRYL